MERSIERTFLRRREVEKRIGMSCSGIYAMMERGDFPKPVRLTPKAVGWVLAEIVEWEQARIAASRKAA